MRTARIKGTGSSRVVDLPTTWEEAGIMLREVTDPYYDRRGGNVWRLGTVARVALGMFPGLDRSTPTMALIALMQKICEHKGAGLER